MTSERVRKIKDFLELFIFRYKRSKLQEYLKSAMIYIVIPQKHYDKTREKTKIMWQGS